MADTAEHPFMTVDARGIPVDRRVSSAAAMREIYRKFQAEDRAEADRRKRILNIYNGNLPYNTEKLRQMNLANLTNINLLGLKGYIDARVSAVTDLALDTVPLVELRPIPMERAGPLASKAAEIIADEWSTTLRDGGAVLPCLAGMVRECDLYGLGPVSWTSARAYEPVSLRRGQLKFAMDASVVSSKNEIYMFESPVPIHYFMRLFDHPDSAREEGWDIKAVKKYLIEVYKSEVTTESQAGDSTGTSVDESVLIEMRQNRWVETSQFKVLRLLHAYIKEKDGKIRHTICPTTAEPDMFLFDKEAAYENMDQCMIWLPASVVEAEARASRGIASYVAPIEDVNNRLACQMYDAGFRAGSFMLVSKSPGQQHQQSIVERGPYTIIPGDLVPAQAQVVAPNIQQLASLREMGSHIGYNNATGARGAGSMPERMYSGADRKTREQVASEENSRARGESSLFATRTMAIDKIFRETFRRFMNLVNSEHDEFPEIDDFIRRCGNRGVSREMLKKATEFYTVYTNRILVTGGGTAYAGVLTQLLSGFGGSFDEPGRNMIARDIVKYRLGSKAADRYRPEETRDKAPSDAMSLAVLENNSIRRGEAALVGVDQLHWTHIPVHGQIIDEIAQIYQQSPQQIQDPQRMLNILQGASQHIQRHVQLGGMQPGMKESAKQVITRLASLSPLIKGLTLMAATIERQRKAEMERRQKEMAALQQRAQGQEAAVAMHEQDNKAKLKMREQNLMHVARMTKVGQDHQVALAKAEADAKIDIAKQTARIAQGSSTMGYSPMQPMSEPREFTEPAGTEEVF